MVDRRGRREKKVRVRRRVENGDEGTQSETFARDFTHALAPRSRVRGGPAVRESVRRDENFKAFKMVRKEKGEIAVARRTDEDDGGEGKHTKERRRHYVDIRDGDVFKCTGATLVAMHTPGHAEDHVCFQLLGDDDEGDAVFAGDCLMNGSTAEFEDLSAYSRSLRNCLKRSRSPTRLVAGKPSLVTAKERTRR